MEILYSALVLFVLAVLFGVAIVLVNKKFAVEEDPKIEAVLAHLSGANCGACGKAGCADFAKALVEGTASLNDCNPTAKEKKEEILKILGSGAPLAAPTVVVTACGGGVECEDKYEYQGYGDCASVELLAGGRKACPVGCIGMGKCVNLCPHHAIVVEKGVAVVDQKRCVGCGNCVVGCPKLIIKRIPANATYYIACSSCDKGKDVRAYCKKGCIACGICAKNCPAEAITMQNNLPVIDYSLCTACGICAEKCPRKCIRLLTERR